MIRRRIHDPGHMFLHRGLRLGILAPIFLLVVDVWIGGSIAALFGVFALTVLLAFIDFGGPAGSRALAYVGTTLVGAALIVVATPFSDTVVAATVVTAILVFAIRFSGALGGHVEAAGVGLILAVVLAIVIEAPFDEVTSRLAGWFAAGAVALAAALVLWPRYEVRRFSHRAAATARALAAAIRDRARVADARSRIEELRRALLELPFRPRGPWRRDRSLRRVVDGLYRIGDSLPLDEDRTPRAGELREASAAALDDAAARLDGGADAPDLTGLEEERAAQLRAATEGAGGALASGRAPGEVLGDLDAMARLRRAAHEAETVAANAIVETGGEPPPADRFVPPLDLPGASSTGPAADAAILLRGQLRLSSSRMRDSARAALGISLAVLVAGLTDVSHGFWVVLAALLALRSNAAGTARTAIQAVLGTIGGFVVATGIMLLAGDETAVLWVALPLASFMVGFAPGAIHFTVGQASFAVFVVVLFNLLEPAGWETGLIRVEDVALGCGVTLVVAILLWPRGAREEIGRAAGGGLAHGAAYAEGAVGWLLAEDADTGSLDSEHDAVTGSLTRTSEALAQHVGEPGTQLSREAVIEMLTAPSSLRSLGDVVRDVGVLLGTGNGAPRLRETSTATIARFGELGAALERGATGTELDRVADAELPDLDEPRPEVIAALEAWRDTGADADRDRALRLVMLRHLVGLTAERMPSVREAACEVAALASRRWWR